jgi:hypothetical protein
MHARSKFLALPVTVVLAAAGIGGAAEALPADDRAPCDRNRAVVVGGCPRQTAALPESDEDRVAKWLIDKILNMDLYADPVVDFTASEITAATGVDATRLDLDRIRERVLARLHEASRWGEVRLRFEERDEPRAADDDRRKPSDSDHSEHDSVRTGAAAVPSASHRFVAPAAAPRLVR